jgi:spore coat protein U-like protein
MTFTGYSPFGGAAYATADLTVSCGPGAARPSVSVAAAPRTMTAAGAPALPFELCHDASCNAPWTASDKVAFPAARGAETTVTLIFGEIPAGQDVAATTYAAPVVVALYNGNNPNPETLELTVQATVAATCEVVAGALAFGSYDAIGANASTPLDAQGSIGVRCTRNTPYTVGLDFGANASGTTRRMANGAARLAYDVYSDASRTNLWTPSATVPGNAPSTAEVPLPVYGRIPPAQLVASGTFQDTVLATVTF